MANASGGSRGLFALAAGLPDLGTLLLGWLHTPWLGPGLVLALLLLATLRSARPAAYKPLHRRIHSPRLDRYQGERPQRHRDLEI